MHAQRSFSGDSVVSRIFVRRTAIVATLVLGMWTPPSVRADDPRQSGPFLPLSEKVNQQIDEQQTGSSSPTSNTLLPAANSPSVETLPQGVLVEPQQTVTVIEDAVVIGPRRFGSYDPPPRPPEWKDYVPPFPTIGPWGWGWGGYGWGGGWGAPWFRGGWWGGWGGGWRGGVWPYRIGSAYGAMPWGGFAGIGPGWVGPYGPGVAPAGAYVPSYPSRFLGGPGAGWSAGPWGGTEGIEEGSGFNW